MAEPAGRLITFEGGEGAGKTTQVERLARRFAASGLTAMVTREPGGTVGAEAIRELLVAGAADRWLPMTELLLLLAARHDHVRRRIGPALAKGEWVLCDRFSDSTKVYQGLAGEIEASVIDRLHELVLGACRPALTIVLDLPVEEGLARRRRSAEENRFERKPAGFHERVRQGFLALAAAEPERCVVIDADQPADLVERKVAAAVMGRLGVALGTAT